MEDDARALEEVHLRGDDLSAAQARAALRDGPGREGQLEEGRRPVRVDPAIDGVAGEARELQGGRQAGRGAGE